MLNKSSKEIKKIKDYFKNLSLQAVLDNIKSLPYKEYLHSLVEKISSLKKEDVYYFYLSHRNTIFLSIFTVLLIGLSIFLLLWIKKFIIVKNELDEAVTKIEIVTDKKYLSLIKKEKLRTFSSVVDTTYVKLYNSMNEKEYLKLENKLKTLFLYLMVKDKNPLYSNYVKTLLLSNGLSFSNNKQILYKNLSKILSKVDFTDPLIKSYLASFPSVKIKTKDKILGTFSKVLSNLYEYELITILASQAKQAHKLKSTYNQYQAPYKYFLSYLYLPKIDIWTDSFSNKINPDIFGSEYLNKADYIDINLIKYWSNFFSQSYSGLLYQGKKNNIIDIKLSNLKTEKNKNIMDVGLSVKFQLADDQSFYGLISKLTLTSNVKNIMLLNEFTYYLWNNIKLYLSSQLSSVKLNNLTLWNKLLYYNIKNCSSSTSNSCLKFFGCKDLTLCSKSDIYSDNVTKLLNSKKLDDSVIKTLADTLINKLKNNFNYDIFGSSFYRYITNNYESINDIDVLVGARLYDCIKNNGYCWDIFDSNYTQIVSAIKRFANCSDKNSMELSDTCKIKFIRKFNTNYFIAYTMVDRLGELNYSLLDRLKDIYNNVPNVLQLWKFTFTKLTSSNFANNMLVKYVANVNLSVYYKYLTQDSYNKILSYIWQSECKSVTKGRIWSLSLAYNYVNNIYKQLYKTNLGADEIYNLQKLISIIKSLQSETKKSSLLDKLLANLQVYRIFKERGYCK